MSQALLFGGEPRPWFESDPGIPAFSILNARNGEWQGRKARWLAEVGSGLDGRSAAAMDCHDGRNGSPIEGHAVIGTSGFDPVLAELVYRWYSRPGWQVVDPFCGGVTRGAVAVTMGRAYWGCDLSAEQVAANRAFQDEKEDRRRTALRERWIVGDAFDALDSAPIADLVFTCPPYGSLERYSQHRRDLSAMPWPAFLEAYRAILAKASERLKPNRFAVVVVGNFRDRRDISGRLVHQDRPLRNLVGETIDAFEAAGIRWYDEAHVVTSIGTLAARTAYVWPRSRKIGRTHQTVLVFVKGCPKIATREIKP